MRDFGTVDPPSPSDAGTLAVSVLSPGDLDAAFMAEWRDLDADAAVPNPFFAPWFLRPALTHLDAQGRVRLCTVRDGEGRLAALFPFEIGTRYARLPLRHVAVWKHPHGYDGAPLLRAGCAVEALAAILGWIDTRPFGARFLRLTTLPCDAPMQGIVDASCALRGRAPREQSRIERAVLPGRGDYDAIMATALPGKKRKELRRQARRFDELGESRLAAVPDCPDAIARAAADFIDLENAGWKATAAHGEPLARSAAERAFFMDAMEEGARAGAVSCLSLTLDSRPAAMLFCLRAGDRLAAFKTSYDERHAAYSPGMRLLMEATRRALEDGRTARLDSCARPGHPVVDRLWPDRLAIRQLNIPTRHRADAALLDLAAAVERAKQRVLAS